MELRRFTRLFYVFQFFFDFILIYAVEKLFFLSRGLDLAQIGVLLFVWSVMTLILEVPTGAIADRWSRRKMLVLSGVFFSICYLIWIVSTSFGMFLLGFLFRTLGATFASGTLQAYVYDFLTVHDLEAEFERIWGNGNALRTLGIGVAMLLGGFLSQKSYSLPLMISAISILTISGVAFVLPEMPVIVSTGEVSYWEFLKQSVKTVRDSDKLMRVVLYTAVIFTTFASLEEYNDVYLNFLGYPNSMIGVVFAVALAVQSGASVLAYRLKKHVWASLNLIAGTGIVILVLATLVRHPIMAIPVLLLGVFLESGRVLIEGVIQTEVSSEQRATISSLNSFVLNVIPVQLVFGFVAAQYRLQLSYGVLAVFCLSYFVLLPTFRLRDQV